MASKVIPKIYVTAKRHKMGKSRGNGISPDDIVHKVYRLEPNYEFRDFWGNVIPTDDVRRVEPGWCDFIQISTRQPILCFKVGQDGL